MKRGILLLGHGSRRSTANLGLVTLAELVQAGLGMRVLPAYFQFERPNLADTVERFVNEGVTEIVVVPALLFPGVHLKEDIPAALGELEARYGERVRLILTEGFGPDPRLAEIVVERVHAAVAGMPEDGAAPGPPCRAPRRKRRRRFQWAGRGSLRSQSRWHWTRPGALWARRERSRTGSRTRSISPAAAGA